MELTAKTSVSIQARVFRIAWDRKPFFIPRGVWMALGRRRFPGTGRWENLGQIASSEEGTAEIVPRERVVHTAPSSARS